MARPSVPTDNADDVVILFRLAVLKCVPAAIDANRAAFGAVLVILFVVAGIFISPGSSGRISGQEKPQAVEADVIVRGLNVLNPESLMDRFRKGSKLSFVIRNQPAGQVDIKSVRQLDRLLAEK